MAEEKTLLDIADASGQRDLQILLKAKIEAQNAHVANPADPELKRVYIEAKRLSDAEEARVRKFEAERDKRAADGPDSGAILPNLHQVEQYLNGLGYRCSYKKLKAASGRRELVDRRGGGWTRRSAEQYARAYLARQVDADPALDQSAAPAGSDGVPSAAERKIERQADLLEVNATKARMELAERTGRLTPTATVEAELGDRAKAFRMGLERFGHEQAESVAELFGGSRRQAGELARRLGFAEGEESERAIALIIDFCLDRARAFPRFFSARVDGFLDAYATGRWWTEDMGRAWELYQRNIDRDIPEVSQ